MVQELDILINQPIKIFSYNQISIKMIYNSSVHKNTNHIEIHYQFV